MLMLGPKPVKHLRSEGIASPPPTQPIARVHAGLAVGAAALREGMYLAVTNTHCTHYCALQPVPLGPATALGKLMVTTHPTSIIQLYTYIAYGILWLTYTQTCLSLSRSVDVHYI